MKAITAVRIDLDLSGHFVPSGPTTSWSAKSATVRECLTTPGVQLSRARAYVACTHNARAQIRVRALRACIACACRATRQPPRYLNGFTCGRSDHFVGPAAPNRQQKKQCSDSLPAKPLSTAFKRSSDAWRRPARWSRTPLPEPDEHSTVDARRGSRRWSHLPTSWSAHLAVCRWRQRDGPVPASAPVSKECRDTEHGR